MNRNPPFDEHHEPTDRDFETAVGKSAPAWRRLREYLRANYDFAAELLFDRKRAVWFIRYRTSGRTLCTLIVGTDGFTTLVVLGKKEVAKAETLADYLGQRVRTLLNETEQLHDGRWLWIDIRTIKHVKDVQTLLTAKKRPTQVAGGSAARRCRRPTTTPSETAIRPRRSTSRGT